MDLLIDENEARELRARCERLRRNLDASTVADVSRCVDDCRTAGLPPFRLYGGELLACLHDHLATCADAITAALRACDDTRREVARD